MGNILLRRMQYRAADDPHESCRIARSMIFGKIYNARWSVERTRRDHPMRIDEQRFANVSAQLQAALPQIAAASSGYASRAGGQRSGSLFQRNRRYDPARERHVLFS